MFFAFACLFLDTIIGFLVFDGNMGILYIIIRAEEESKRRITLDAQRW